MMKCYCPNRFHFDYHSQNYVKKDEPSKPYTPAWEMKLQFHFFRPGDFASALLVSRNPKSESLRNPRTGSGVWGTRSYRDAFQTP